MYKVQRHYRINLNILECKYHQSTYTINSLAGINLNILECKYLMCPIE